MTLPTYIEMARSQSGLPGLESEKASALERLQSADWPSQKSESYRYAPLTALKAEAFTLAAQTSVEAPQTLLAGSVQILIANGFVDHSGLANAPAGVSALNRASAEDSIEDLDSAGDTLSHLNTALASDGVVLAVDAGADIETPIELVHLLSGAEGTAAHVRHVITLGAGSKLTLVERFVGDASKAWTDESLTVTLEDGAQLTHIRLMEDGANTTHTARLSGTAAEDARYAGLTLNIGGAEARFQVAFTVTGAGAHVQNDAVILAGTGQSREVLTHVTHAVGGATSDQIIRSIAGGRGRASFQGKVTVAVDAQQTEADQSVKSLMLDRTAEVNAKPELEIYADDVKCSHGATVGELDQTALFYLTSRGVDPESAEAILVEAFLQDTLVNIADADLRADLGERIQAALAAVRSGDTA